MGSQTIRRAFLLTLLLLFAASCQNTPAYKDLAQEYLSIAEAYREAGQEERASDFYMKAYDLDPSLKVAGFNLMRLYLDQKKYKEALVLADQLLQEDPDNLLVKEAKAYAHYYRGEDQEARTLYQNLLNESPGDYRILYNLVQLLDEAGEYEVALPYLETLKELWPEKDTLPLVLVKSYQEAGRVDEALLLLEELREKNTLEGSGLYRLGRIYQEREEFAEALEVYGEAAGQKMADDSEKADLFFRQAEIFLLVVENEDEGLGALKTALSAGFDDEDRAAQLISGGTEGWSASQSGLREKVESFFEEASWSLDPLASPKDS